MDSVLNLHNSASKGSLRALRQRSWRALMEPARFFRTDYATLDTPSLLTFGIGNAWAASVTAFFLQTINSFLLARLLDRWMQRLLRSEDGFDVWNLGGRSFLYTSGLTLLGPFLFLLQAVFGSFLVFLFARLLIEDRDGAPEPVTYRAALRIQATSLVSQWYAIVPVFGGVLALVAQLVLLVTGVRERFSVSTRRASAVVLAPYLLFFFAALLFGALLLLVASQLPYQELLDADGGRFGF